MKSVLLGLLYYHLVSLAETGSVAQAHQETASSAYAAMVSRCNTIPSHNGAMVMGQSCYFVSPSNQTWSESFDTCLAMGAKLAIILCNDVYLELTKAGGILDSSTSFWVWLAMSQVDPVIGDYTGSNPEIYQWMRSATEPLGNYTLADRHPWFDLDVVTTFTVGSPQSQQLYKAEWDVWAEESYEDHALCQIDSGVADYRKVLNGRRGMLAIEEGGVLLTNMSYGGHSSISGMSHNEAHHCAYFCTRDADCRSFAFSKSNAACQLNICKSKFLVTVEDGDYALYDRVY